LTGLPLSDLAVLHSREVVAFVLAQEVALGRVAHEDGGFRLVEAAFDTGTLAALRALGPTSTVEESGGRDSPAVPLPRALGDVHGDETPRPKGQTPDRSEAGREAVGA
jgi:hypothetical protein